MTEETWAEVVTHPGRYEVSTRGRVRVKSRSITRGFCSVTLPEAILKQTVGGRCKNYKRVMLSGPKRHAYVHHLVAETFIGPRPEGEKVLHRDDQGFHNDLDNLRYGTQEENALDRHVAETAAGLEPAPF